MAEIAAAAGPTGAIISSNGVPVALRLAGEIVKPKDPYTFQRNCVVLFREELRDPNTKEYGRNGQNQGGIDILGYRDGDPARAVGIQCRNIQKSLKQTTILKDCRSALALEFGLSEIIFATTAPDDTKADQAAKSVEKVLRAEGHDITVHVYGWGQLQTKGVPLIHLRCAGRKALSRTLRVSVAAALNSERASASRPARNGKSPLPAGTPSLRSYSRTRASALRLLAKDEHSL